jgi:hypothetical protein
VMVTKQHSLLWMVQQFEILDMSKPFDDYG